jgi:hypothetical protein
MASPVPPKPLSYLGHPPAPLLIYESFRYTLVRSVKGDDVAQGKVRLSLADAIAPAQIFDANDGVGHRSIESQKSGVGNC